ncbi:MAG: hypothetical protein AB7R67_20145 [Vicinamibacterales bacterium]
MPVAPHLDDARPDAAQFGAARHAGVCRRAFFLQLLALIAAPATVQAIRGGAGRLVVLDEISGFGTFGPGAAVRLHGTEVVMSAADCWHRAAQVLQGRSR